MTKKIITHVVAGVVGMIVIATTFLGWTFYHEIETIGAIGNMAAADHSELITADGKSVIAGIVDYLNTHPIPSANQGSTVQK